MGQIRLVSTYIQRAAISSMYSKFNQNNFHTEINVCCNIDADLEYIGHNKIINR